MTRLAISLRGHRSIGQRHCQHLRSARAENRQHRSGHGGWHTAYDVLNEIVSQTDAKSQTTTVDLRSAGAADERVEPDLTSTWAYDTAAHGMGRLASATTSAGYSRTHDYDSLGRPAQAQMTIDGNTTPVDRLRCERPHRQRHLSVRFIAQ